MKITVNTNTYNIDDNTYLNVSSGEAFLYPIDANRLLKKYIRDDLGNQERKIRALCNLSGNFENIFGKNAIAYPLDVAYEETGLSNQFCGFAMNYFSGCLAMEKCSFNLIDNGYLDSRMTDAAAVKVIYKLFELLDSIHFKRIILGDIKPSNIIINIETQSPVIVDFDSAQVPPNFPCTAISPEYLDPKIEQQGKTLDGYYLVSTDSDIYSMTVVCYEFIVGMLPYDITVEPAITEMEAKAKGLNLLVFHKHKLHKLRSGYELQKNEPCRLALRRLDLIEKNYKELYEFFCTVLVFDKRLYLAKNKKKTMTPEKIRSKKFFSRERKYNKKDPNELLTLINEYGIAL